MIWQPTPPRLSFLSLYLRNSDRLYTGRKITKKGPQESLPAYTMSKRPTVNSNFTSFLLIKKKITTLKLSFFTTQTGKLQNCHSPYWWAMRSIWLPRWSLSPVDHRFWESVLSKQNDKLKLSSKHHLISGLDTTHSSGGTQWSAINPHNGKLRLLKEAISRHLLTHHGSLYTANLKQYRKHLYERMGKTQYIRL